MVKSLLSVFAVLQLLCLSHAMCPPMHSNFFIKTWHPSTPKLNSDGTTSQTFKSNAMPTFPGLVRNTDPQQTILPFPAGPIAITGFHAELVDASGTSIPLDQSYLHHWVVYNNIGNAGPCQTLTYIFGVGAESRRTSVSYPAGYGYIAQGTEVWMANIHAIDTRAPVLGVHTCIECMCQYPWFGGRIDCCPDNSTCPTYADPHTFPLLQTYLQYTVTYIPKPTSGSVIPLSLFVFDVAQCAIEFNLPACNGNRQGGWWVNTMTSQDAVRMIPSAMQSNSPCLVETMFDYTATHNMTIVFAAGHVHVGGINLTLSKNGVDVCVSTSTYGTGTTAGNEQGYLVGMSTCLDKIHVVPGDVLSVRSVYDASIPHFGLMGLMYAAAAVYDGGKVTSIGGNVLDFNAMKRRMPFSRFP